MRTATSSANTPKAVRQEGLERRQRQAASVISATLHRAPTRQRNDKDEDRLRRVSNDGRRVAQLLVARRAKASA